jgi:hypothetical protein
MTPNNMASGFQENSNKLAGTRAVNIICLLAGIWFFVSPWVYGAPLTGEAWNSWIVGALMFIFGCAQIVRPTFSTSLSWANMVLGIWAFFSPWLYGYVFNTGLLVNSLCVGVIVFVLSIAAAAMSRRSLAHPAAHI